jgi:Rrf2 family transcriptional regulator, cysteine metabolism repressor
MNNTVKGQYALQAIFDLAARESTEPVRIADIAQRQKIPQKFLELILAGLKQSGFVESRRGAEGGYLLARPASTITVGEVLRSVESSRAAARSDSRKNEIDPLADVWNRVDEAVSAIVDHTNFADIVRAWRERQARYVPTWDI